MKAKNLLVCLALATSHSMATPLSIARRWDQTVCTPQNAGVAIPDSANFMLPLESYRQAVCRDFCVGDLAACTVKSEVCWNFVSTNLTFDYKPVPGYTYTESDIYLGLTTPEEGYTPQYNTANGFCTISADASSVHCSIPYDEIVDTEDIFPAMCPNGDREALIFSLYIKAMLNSAATGDIEGSVKGSCSDYPACSAQDIPYWQLSYRCTKCPEISSSIDYSSMVSTTSTISIESSTTALVSTTESSTTEEISSTTSTTPTSDSTSEAPSATPTTSSSTTSSSIPPSSTTSSTSSIKTSSTSSPTSSKTPTPTSTLTKTTLKTSTKTTSTSTYCPPHKTSTTSTKPGTKTTTKKPTPTPTPTHIVKTCPFGNAFGHSPTTPKSSTLDSIASCPSSCRRWGWYTKFTPAQLTAGLAGISGPLYVGAGGNYIFKATQVGTWRATLALGKLYVTYDVSTGVAGSALYGLRDVHVDVGCTPIKSCAPEGYKYVNKALVPAGIKTFTTPGLSVPASCARGESLYLIVYAVVDKTYLVEAGKANGFKCPSKCAL